MALLHPPFQREKSALTSGLVHAARIKPLLPVLTLAALLIATGPAATADTPDPVAEAIDNPPPHPRLFLPADQTQTMRQKVADEPLLDQTWNAIRRQADEILELEPMEREQVGRRLLGVSRTVLKRVSYLALAHRMTDEPAYLERAEQEMLAAAGFSDWNPSHFLDVAEMTAALAIGYDWLHDGLSAESRQTIREAIVSKGLQTSFDEAGHWVTTTNNWAQVCHAGLTMGALAVMEDQPDLAQRVILRALDNIHRPMDVYGPNGAYPEGPGYWVYGTVYNVLLIDALDSVLGSDFQLTQHDRFMASANYYLHTHGSTTLYFNYSDNRETPSVAPPMYWFARELNQPELLWMEQRKLEDFVDQPPQADGSGDRLLPFLLVWADRFDAINPPSELHYTDDGDTPIGIHRTGWDEAAVYAGLKAGMPAAAHGQMDIGSFVMEADGVRWAVDLGLQNYHSLEDAGVDLWNAAQDSERWTVFRLNNRSKNTLVVNDQPQRVSGFAPITAFSDAEPMPHTIIDMTDTYDGQLASAQRGLGLRSDGAVLVQDELTAPGEETEVRWGMVTRAEVEIISHDRAVLRQDGQQLGLHLLDAPDAEFQIYDTANPPADYDAPNPGTRMIGFTITLEPGTEQRLTVLLNPGGPAEEPADVAPLTNW